MNELHKSGLLEYIGRLTESLCSTCEALHGGHIIGFPDIRGESKEWFVFSVELEGILAIIHDPKLTELINQLYKESDRLVAINEEIVEWLAKDLGGLDLSKQAGRRDLLKQIDKASKEAALTREYPPKWILNHEYQLLLDKSKKTLDRINQIAHSLRMVLDTS